MVTFENIDTFNLKNPILDKPSTAVEFWKKREITLLMQCADFGLEKWNRKGWGVGKTTFLISAPSTDELNDC